VVNKRRYFFFHLSNIGREYLSCYLPDCINRTGNYMQAVKVELFIGVNRPGEIANKRLYDRDEI
jgi:hypothetical protein